MPTPNATLLTTNTLSIQSCRSSPVTSYGPELDALCAFGNQGVSIEHQRPVFQELCDPRGPPSGTGHRLGRLPRRPDLVLTARQPHSILTERTKPRSPKNVLIR